MSDLTKRAIDFASESDSFTGQEVRCLVWQLTDRIEADEVLMRQALAYITSDGDFLAPDSVESTRQLLASLRTRLQEKGPPG